MSKQLKVKMVSGVKINCLEIVEYIFRNPIMRSLCTGNDRDARYWPNVASCCVRWSSLYLHVVFFLRLPRLSCPVKTVCQITEVKLSDHS